MRVRFTRPAQADLVRIHDHIHIHHPEAASRVIARLMEVTWSLADLPEQGRKTDEPGVFVLVVPQLRYFVFYKITDEQVHILHVRHTSRSRFWL